MTTRRYTTRPAGHEALAVALLGALAAARRALPPRSLRAPATPKPNCHDAVDAWIATHSGAQAVRGWIVLELDGGLPRFYAHSIARAADGVLVDPTSATDNPSQLFVPHPRELPGFFELLCGRDAPHELQVFDLQDGVEKEADKIK